MVQISTCNEYINIHNKTLKVWNAIMGRHFTCKHGYKQINLYWTHSGHDTMACKEKSCNEKLIELSIAAYRVEKPPCSFSRGVKTSTFFSSTNNIIMISTLKIFIKKEKKVHIHIGARTSEFYLILFDFILF